MRPWFKFKSCHASCSFALCHFFPPVFSSKQRSLKMSKHPPKVDFLHSWVAVLPKLKPKKLSDTNLVASIKKERPHLRLTFVAEKRPCLSSLITSRDRKTWCDNFRDHALPPLTSLQSESLAQATQNSAIQSLTPSHRYPLGSKLIRRPSWRKWLKN